MNQINSRQEYRFSILFTYTVLFIFLFISIGPILLTLFTAFRPTSQGSSTPWAIPFPPTFKNFIYTWITGKFSIYFLNSILISSIDSLIMVVIISSAAYILAFFNFKFKKIVQVYFLIGMIVPPASIILPIFLTVRDLGLYNNHLGVILSDIGLAIPIFIFLVYSYMSTIHYGIRESAIVDGASEIIILKDIIIPISKPVLLTTILLEFIWSWNDLLLRLVFLTRDSLRTLTIGLMYFQGTQTRNVFGITSGAIIIMVLPVILFLIFRRKFIQGITSGSVKG